jgi:hypothetical protein
LSDSPSGNIRSSLGYVIDVLCDHDRYDLNDRKTVVPFFLVPCLGNTSCARKNRRGAYKEASSVAPSAQAIGAGQGQDEFSFFNAVALVTLQALAWGPGDHDAKNWRKNIHHMADGCLCTRSLANLPNPSRYEPGSRSGQPGESMERVHRARAMTQPDRQKPCPASKQSVGFRGRQAPSEGGLTHQPWLEGARFVSFPNQGRRNSRWLMLPDRCMAKCREVPSRIHP